jgi:hypothetical protein
LCPLAPINSLAFAVVNHKVAFAPKFVDDFADTPSAPNARLSRGILEAGQKIRAKSPNYRQIFAFAFASGLLPVVNALLE